jgi:hypothetical protein
VITDSRRRLAALGLCAVLALGLFSVAGKSRHALAGPSRTTSHLGMSRLLGTWLAENPNTRGIVKVVLRSGSSGPTMHWFGACSPSPCNNGVHPATLFGSSVSAQQAIGFTSTDNEGFAIARFTGYLQIQTLVIVYTTHFRDNSGRTDYLSVGRFNHK